MTKSQRLCDKQDTLTDETIQRQSSARLSLRRSTHTGHVPQPRISFADDSMRGLIAAAKSSSSQDPSFRITENLIGRTKIESKLSKKTIKVFSVNYNTIFNFIV